MTSEMIWDLVAIAMAVIAMILANSARRHADEAIRIVLSSRSDLTASSLLKRTNSASLSQAKTNPKGVGPL